jgi:hypothetical protein
MLTYRKGPIAVPAKYLPKVLRLQTRVNGELRQDATTEDLIFSIPTLIKTLSEGQTLQPGDVLATGTVSNNPTIYPILATNLFRVACRCRNWKEAPCFPQIRGQDRCFRDWVRKFGEQDCFAILDKLQH